MKLLHNFCDNIGVLTEKYVPKLNSNIKTFLSGLGQLSYVLIIAWHVVQFPLPFVLLIPSHLMILLEVLIYVGEVTKA